MLPSVLSFLILVLGIRLRSTCLQGTCFTNKISPYPEFYDFFIIIILLILLSQFNRLFHQKVHVVLLAILNCFQEFFFYLPVCDFKDWFFLCVGVFSFTVCAPPTEVRRGCCIPWDQNCQLWWASMWCCELNLIHKSSGCFSQRPFPPSLKALLSAAWTNPRGCLFFLHFS